ncbi:MAG: glutamate-1-semialdehyde 2,1-aminomutase [Armatimonadetes bacterium]|nr:glutamate-1-semialdehyde 2,1-aminomutase [Armatimonadota bacterium]MDE2207970.1 glutamate-1-semialdehyde 2,1-aminomutase [Armatimonadota bacterium]
MPVERSSELMTRAERHIPGGVNSPVRAFRSVGGEPRFLQRGSGCHVWDADGNRYIDMVSSWGPLILGHAHPDVLRAACAQAELGTTFGAPTALEVTLAEEVCRAVPSVQMLRLVSSGTEATMSAIRVARGFTGRNRIVKFAGCYHGHADCLLAAAGSGVASLGLPDSAGVPPAAVADTLTLPYNDIGAAEKLFKAEGGRIACVIVEPVAGNMGLVPPQSGFLEALRRLTATAGALLIFDEVISGFRVGLGGAQGEFGIAPDISTFGKILGGGFPLGAYGGRRDVMEQVAPLGPVYQAGTLSGNPVATAAGIETLRQLRNGGGALYARLNGLAAGLAAALRAGAKEAGLPVYVSQYQSMLTVFFTDQDAVPDYDAASRCDRARFGRWFHHLLDHGVYWPPSQFETAFVSAAMTPDDISMVAENAALAFHAAAG